MSSILGNLTIMSHVPAAANTLRILTLLSTLDSPVSAARIQQELGLPRSTTYHLLNVMIEYGYVMYVPERRAYGLGIAAYGMSGAYATQQPLVRAATRPAKHLAELVSGTCHVSRIVGDEVVYILELPSPGAPRLITGVGVRLPAMNTASGKAMLSMMDTKRINAVLGSVPEELLEIRRQGYAEEIEVVAPGQESVAVPILNHLQEPSAALAVTFATGSITGSARMSVVEDLQMKAAGLEKRVYGSAGRKRLAD